MTREELNRDIQDELIKEENKSKRKKIIIFLIKTILILTILSILFFTYTTYISTVKTEVREYRIINEKIPDAFNGLKIIQISDLRFGSTFFSDDVKKVKKMINVRKPDIVVFTGDLIDKNYDLNSKEQESLIKELKKINTSLGKYAILGDEDNEKISTILNQSNFTILRNEYDEIFKDCNESIIIIGLSSKKKGQDIDKAYSYFKQENHNSNVFTIAIMHEPDTIDDIIPAYNSDLYMAGHSLNGEIRIPFIKYSLFKSDGAQKYDQDYYEINKSKLYVSGGLGSKKGIRLFCRPSINFYRLSNK